MNDWIGLSFLAMLFLVYGSMIYYMLKIQEIIRIDISFLVSRKIFLKKRMLFMFQLSLIVAFIHSIILTLTLTLTLTISNTDNFGFFYNVFAGFLFFAGLEFCALCLITLSSIIHNMRARALMLLAVIFGVGIIMILLTKNEIWKVFHSIWALLIFLSFAIVYLIKETYKKCDIV